MATGQPDKAIPLARAFLEKTAELGDRLPAKVHEAFRRRRNCWKARRGRAR